MRRRPPPADEDRHPRRLVEYRAEDWPDAPCHPECAYWQAVDEWRQAHPDDDLHRVTPGPDGPWHPELI